MVNGPNGQNRLNGCLLLPAGLLDLFYGRHDIAAGDRDDFIGNQKIVLRHLFRYPHIHGKHDLVIIGTDGQRADRAGG